MSRIQTERERLLTVLMQAYSLSELLDIMKSVCRNMPHSSMNTKSRHFGHFKLTLFGLTVKADGLTERMELNLDLLRKTMPECEDSYHGLKRIREGISLAHGLIRGNKIDEGKERIIGVADEYSAVFEQAMRLKEKM